MINITEIKPTKKISGLSSFLITFKFNQEIINIIKTLSVFSYNKKDYTWEIPSNELANILDQLVKIDSIQLKLLKEDNSYEEIVLTDNDLKDFKLMPMKHQIEAVKFILNRKKCLILDAPGLGKSFELITAASILHKRGLISHCMIICGVDSLRQNWKAEIQKFSKESVCVLGERVTKNGTVAYTTVNERCEQLKAEIKEFFIVVNVATIRDDKFVEAFKKSANKIGMIAVDEIHRCFTYDTLIDTDQGKLLIGDIVKNNLNINVLSYNEANNKIELKPIINYRKINNGDDVIKLEFINETGKHISLKCSKDHLIYTKNRGYVKASLLTSLDDIFMRSVGLKWKLIKKTIINNVNTLYDLEIKDNHNYFANGVLVHNCSSKSSQQGSNLLKLSADYKVAMTGTLITNSPLSCYLPLNWTENDHSTLGNYKMQYCEFGGFKNSQIIGYKNLDMLKEEIDSCSLRRTLDQVRDSMPKKIIKTELVEMSTEHDKFYSAIKKGVKEEADKIKLNSSNLLALCTRLRQASSCPSILTTQDIKSSKIERCCEIVEDLIDQDEKVVVVSQFKDSVYQLEKLLARYNPLVATGDVNEANMYDRINKFQNDQSYKLFIATSQKCGTGVTLNAAKYMIVLDCPYTYSEFSQTADRIYRITNTHPAIINVLMCKDTIDEHIWSIINKKKDLSEYMVDGKENALSQSLQQDMINIINN